MAGMEYTPVRLDESEDMSNIKYTTQKFKFHGEEVKVELPKYEDQDGKVFIKLVSDFWNMATTYKLFDQNMELLFDRFRRCLGRSARTDWDHVVENETLSKQKLSQCIVSMFVRLLGEDTSVNLREYLERTKKPKTMKVRQWVRRIRHLNLYLQILSGGKGDSFDEKELSRKCITPNIPQAWTKDFRLREGHEEKKLSRVIKILEILEHAEERMEKKKEKSNSKSNKENKDGKRSGKSGKDKSKKEKPKNPCKLPNHSGHDWADCFNNPKSKNFKGTAKNWKDETKSGEEANLIEQLEEEPVSEEEEYNELSCIECFLFEILAESSSDEEEKEPEEFAGGNDEMVEAVEESKEEFEISEEDAKVKQLMDRTSNKRKREVCPGDECNPEEESKLAAIEFPPIETGSPER